MMKKLFAPLLYLKIKQKQKFKYDFWAPLAISVIFVCMCYFADSDMVFLIGENGLQKSVMQLLQLLAGFFIASLAAISTFLHASLDKPISGDQATLKHNTFKTEPEILTRRRFLSFMFSYLAFSTIILYLALSLIPIWSQFVWHFVAPTNALIKLFSWLAFMGFTMWFFNILATTIVGLSFLGERVHRPEQTTSKKEKNHPHHRNTLIGNNFLRSFSYVL